MIQYVPKKPIKRGFKVWVRADSDNGFVCEYQVYCRKEIRNRTRVTGCPRLKKKHCRKKTITYTVITYLQAFHFLRIC